MVPAALGVKVNTPAAATFPLLKVEPSSEVTVWANPSLFVHVIFVPAFTVRVEGLKAIPEMLTVPGPGATGGGGVLLLLLPDLLQEIFAAITKAIMPANKILLILIKRF